MISGAWKPPSDNLSRKFDDVHIGLTIALTLLDTSGFCCIEFIS